MAFLSVTGEQDLMLRLRAQAALRIGILVSTASQNDDGTWTVTVYATEDQVPALEQLGYTVHVDLSDAEELADWQDTLVSGPPIA